MSTVACPVCGFTNSAQSRFCSKCGGSMTSAKPEGAPPIAGFLKMGNRDFIRHVPKFEFTSALGSLRVEVPRGSYGIITVNGKVVALLPPGKQTAVGLTNRLTTLFNSQTDRTEVYLVDSRPVTIGESAEVMGADGQVKKVDFTVEFQAPPLPSPLPTPESASSGGGFWSRLFGGGAAQQDNTSRFDFSPYENLVNNLLQDRDFLPVSELYEDVKSLVAAAAQGIAPDPTRGNALVLSPAAREPLKSWCERNGLRFSERFIVKGSSLSVDLVVGGAPLPMVKICVNPECRADIQSTKRFCHKCGGEQPLLPDPASAPPSLTCPNCKINVVPGKKFCQGCGSPAPKPTTTEGSEKATAPAFTKDGKQLEIDVFMRLESAVSGVSVALDVEALKDRAQEAIASLVRQRVGMVNADDIATREGLTRFEQGMLADARQAIQALNLRLGEFVLLDVRNKSGEWLLKARAEIEHEKQQLLNSREWLAVGNDRLEVQSLMNDLAIRERKVENASKLDALRAQNEFALEEQKLQLGHESAVSRAQMENRRGNEDIEQANADLDVSDAQRASRRNIAVATAQRDEARNLAAAEHEDSLTGLSRDAELLRTQRSNERAEQLTDVAHEMDLEAQTAAHDANLSRQAMKLDSERSRLGVEDELYGARARAEHENQQEDKKLERELTAEERRQQAQLDKLRAMAELDNQIAQREIAAKQTELNAKQDHELRMRETLKTATVEQIAAMTGDAASAARIVEAQAGGATAKALLEQQAKLDAEARAREAALHQANQNQAAQTQAQMFAMMQQMMQTQQASAAATNAAYQQAAQQAQSMSERSMSAMSGVAAQASQRGPTVVVPSAAGTPVAAPATAAVVAKSSPSTCAHCGDSLAPGAAFCNNCGKGLGASA